MQTMKLTLTFAAAGYLAMLLCAPLTAEAVHPFELVGDGKVIAREGPDTDFPSVIRVPDWIDGADRADPDAKYYMYYSEHNGDHIRMKWAESIDGPWTDFDLGGTYNGQSRRGVYDIAADSTRASFTHIAAPDVHVDDVNQRIIMYYHGRNQPPYSEHTNFVATSSVGLNFNDPTHAGGEAGFGPVTHTFDGSTTRDVLLGEDYQRIFEYKNKLYSAAKRAILQTPVDSNDPWAPHPTDPYTKDAWLTDDNPDNYRASAQANGQTDYHSPAASFMASDAFKNHANNPHPGDVILSNGGDDRINHVAVNLLADKEQLEVFYWVRDNPNQFNDIYRIILDLSDSDYENWTVATDGQGEALFDVVLTPEALNDAVLAQTPGADPEFYASDAVSLGDPYLFTDSDGSRYLFFSYVSDEFGGSIGGEGQITAVKLVPEPSTLAVLGVGTLVLMPRRRRR